MAASLHKVRCQSSTITNQLIGTWQMDFRQTKSNASEDKINLLNDLDTQSKDRIESKYKDRQMIFRADKSFSMYIKGAEIIVAKWELVVDEKAIIITPDIGHQLRYDITRLNDRKLIVKPKVKNESSLLFSEWHLSKK